jgi:hypothetical protein
MSNLDGLHDDDKYPRTSFQAFLEQTQIPKEFKRLNLKKLNGLEKFVRDNEVSPFIELISRQEAHSLSIWK